MERFGVATKDAAQRGDWYLAKQIAVGILIAAAVIFLGFHLYLYVALRAAGQVAQEATQQFQQEMESQSAKTKALRRARSEAQRMEAERRAASEVRRRQEAARQAQAAADRAKAEQASAMAKKRAWQQFYTPPKKCTDPPDWDTQVECGNSHIKAKRDFEARWAKGEIL